ncbi:MAG: wax ester/triacylglycerol synthase family O-acyltransferase [Candidatus Binatia bacterium]
MGDYIRLTALDRSFLDVEDRNTHMHIAVVCIFDAAPLSKSSGAVDLDRIRRHIDSRLASIPRYRQRLTNVPFENHPVWVDDYRFNLRYHVRHVSVPRPGEDRQLKRVLGWINSQPLDRERPLWEMWVVEGLEGNRFAIVQKVHHCMIDGLAGAEEMAVLLDVEPDRRMTFPRRWQPRPTPSSFKLLGDAVLRRATAPVVLGRAAAQALVRDPRKSIAALRGTLGGLVSAARGCLPPASETVLNRPIGSQRRFDWLALDLDTVKLVGRKLGGSVNDVVLAVMTAGLRRYFLQHGTSRQELGELTVRAMCPVNRRTETEDHSVGNKVAGMFVDLPVGTPDAAARLRAVHASTTRGKTSGHSSGTALLGSISDWAAPSLIRMVSEYAPKMCLYNTIVTNIPGPPIPLYMQGAQMLETYPLVPLFPNQGLAVALFSYDGAIYWGFNADRELIPDLHEFVLDIEEGFNELAAAANVKIPDRSAERRTAADG